MTRPKKSSAWLSGLALAAILLAGCLPTVDAAGSRSRPRTRTIRSIETTTTTAPVAATTTTVAPPAPTTTTTTAPAPPAPSSGFVHPGVLVGQADLDLVRSKIAAGQQPWKGAYDKLLAGGSSEATADRPTRYRYSSLGYVPYPVPVVQYASDSHLAYSDANGLGWKNIAEAEHPDDAQAAYAHALLWAYTGNQAHADKAIQIMNAWSSTLREIKFDQPRHPVSGQPVYNGGKMQAAWAGSLFARAAEIIRYTGAGWSAGDIARMESMLHDVYLPITITNWSNGANWMTTLAEATISIGVFTNDRAAFDSGVAMWRYKVPTTIYLPTDGPTPLPPHTSYNTAAKIKSLWYNPSSYVSGLHAEALRDISHMAMGLGAMSNAAETARLQGIDLFGEQEARIVAGYERGAGYVNEYLDKVASLGGAQPPSDWKPTGWVGSSFKVGGAFYTGGWEVAYSHYAVGEGISMPNTKRLVERLRPIGPSLHLSWQTLTSARTAS
ncbi:MAG: alginate lyase family protein [Acidimicrobiales bacterium]